MDELITRLPHEFDHLQALLGQYWVVPAGLFVLYFYGAFRFNTPDYDLASDESNAALAGQPWHLLSLAPPMYTTSRKRFRRYSLRYTLILQAAFLFTIFCWSLLRTSVEVASANKIFSVPLPSSESIQYRAIWALFVLTGLLSSFPGLKGVDAWLLKTFHARAFIPDNAKRLADSFRDAVFGVDASIKGEVRSTLIMRDTIRVAEHHATGSLESELLRMLWLQCSLEKKFSQEDHYEFQIRIRRDRLDIERNIINFINDARKYLRLQESAVSNVVTDIDEFFDATTDAQLLELGRQRADLLLRCKAIYAKMCLMAALFVYATTKTLKQSEVVANEIGFEVNIIQVPLWNWEALVKIVLIVFIGILFFNSLVFPTLRYLGWLPVGPHDHGMGREKPFIFSLLITILYGMVLGIAIWFKRFRKANISITAVGAENFIIALAGYCLSAIIVFLLARIVEQSLVSRGLIALAQFSLGVSGYFAGVYLDRELTHSAPSIKLAAYQAGCQFFAAGIGAGFLLPDPAGVAPDDPRHIVLWAVLACQNALAGFILGYIVQHFYSSRSVSGASAQDQQAIEILGDIAVQGRSPMLPQVQTSAPQPRSNIPADKLRSISGGRG